MAARTVLVREDQVQILAPQSADVRDRCEHMFVPRCSEEEARHAVAQSLSYSETLRHLELCTTGGNAAFLKKWLARWDISTEHFDRGAHRFRGRRTPTPLAEILVEGSTFSRGNLQARLYDEGIKCPICELCGQDEMWHGMRMGLILDHVNGIRDDNRLVI